MWLLEAIEHPENYTDEELEEMLRNDEIQTYYQILCETESARQFHLHPDTQSTGDVEQAWNRFRNRHLSKSRQRFRIAASIIGILIISGIAVAAIHFVVVLRHPSTASPTHDINTETIVHEASKLSTTDSLPLNQTPSSSTQKQFDNVTLSEIVSEMAQQYHVGMVVNNEKNAHLRLRFLWDRSQPIEKTIETLNQFNKVQLSFADSTITIE